MRDQAEVGDLSEQVVKGQREVGVLAQGGDPQAPRPLAAASDLSERNFVASVARFHSSSAYLSSYAATTFLAI